jgi:ketosteroid isomerase-like protein
MSQENVEIVRRFQPTPDVDIAVVFRDDAAWVELTGAAASVLHQDFAARVTTLDKQAPFLPGVDGLRSTWLDWLEPWESYRAEIEDVIDVADERVLVLTRDYGRRVGSTAEVRLHGAGLYTMRDGKIARAEFMPRDEALKAVGLEE